MNIKRALANLIDNAISYGGCARVALDQTPQGVRITIDDEGSGIPDTDIPSVFEPFRRLETSRNRGTGGVGLGLTIARQAIEREGGEFYLLNRPEGGLRSEVCLPAGKRPWPGG